VQPLKGTAITGRDVPFPVMLALSVLVIGIAFGAHWRCGESLTQKSCPTRMRAVNGLPRDEQIESQWNHSVAQRPLSSVKYNFSGVDEVYE
jgi:hypothetical protein